MGRPERDGHSSPMAMTIVKTPPVRLVKSAHDARASVVLMTVGKKCQKLGHEAQR
jgi:hypothetical protein